MRKCFCYFGNPEKHYTELSLVLESYPVLEAALIDPSPISWAALKITELFIIIFMYKMRARQAVEIQNKQELVTPSCKNHS